MMGEPTKDPRVRLVPIRLGDLRISEEFETSLTHRRGHVIAWGHVRPSGYWSRSGALRPRWPAVLCQVGARRMLLSPELVVLVEGTRQHWRIADASPSRWAERVSERVSA
jgi:hypothetical protein